MRLDHESLSSPETDILKYHEYMVDHFTLVIILSTTEKCIK